MNKMNQIIYPPGNEHIPPWETVQNHLQKYLEGGGYSGQFPGG